MVIRHVAGDRAGDTTIVTDTRLRRSVDVVVGSVVLLLTLPLLLGLAVAVSWTSPGPVLFRQARVGRGGQRFDIWKLRSMTVAADRLGPLVSGPADPRITAIGRWLRRTRLDELPQLVNLLRGELTLVGPRPEVQRYVEHYGAAERQLFDVRPGIIGPGAVLFATTLAAQLDDADDPERCYVEQVLHPRLALDLDYLAHRCLRRDLALVGQALAVCVRRG